MGWHSEKAARWVIFRGARMSVDAAASSGSHPCLLYAFSRVRTLLLAMSMELRMRR